MKAVVEALLSCVNTVLCAGSLLTETPQGRRSESGRLRCLAACGTTATIGFALPETADNVGLRRQPRGTCSTSYPEWDQPFALW
jgi:hypothetical protein